jgi:flagellar basal-body rod protein FlgF/flagellar basal-body rod protein FlgG
VALGLLLSYYQHKEPNVDSGFYAACAGLRAESQALEVVAHNLANLNTAGFRGQQTNFQSLVAVSGPAVSRAFNQLASALPNSMPTSLVSSALNSAVNNFGVLEGSHLDRTAGNLQTTGNPLDVGIEGAGFFAIQTARGTRYTRNGSFKVSSGGVLLTAAGDPVLGDPALGPKALINVPPGIVSIASDGTLSVNGAIAGTIRLVDFAPTTTLSAEGETLLAAPEGSAKAASQPTLRQGALETSNVNSISAIVTLIGVERQAEMMQRALSLFDTEFEQIASNTLAKV